MPKLTLTVETVTPLLMNGANQTPEIRAASFRGVFRYWLRAVLGGVYQNDIEALKKAETNYFGSTDGASPLRLYVTEQQDTESQIDKISRYKVLPTRFDFDGIRPSYSFDLTFALHPLGKAEAIFNEVFFAGLLAAFNLGAFGKRARRGGGVLRIDSAYPDGVSVDRETFKLLQVAPSNTEKLIQHLNTVFEFISSAQKNLREKLPADYQQKPFGNYPTYPVIDNQNMWVFLGNGYGTYSEALQALWNITGEYHRGAPKIDNSGQIIKNNNVIQTHDNKWAWGYAVGQDRRSSAVQIGVQSYFEDEKTYYCPMITILRNSGIDERRSQKQEYWSSLDHFVSRLATSSDFSLIHGIGKSS